MVNERPVTALPLGAVNPEARSTAVRVHVMLFTLVGFVLEKVIGAVWISSPSHFSIEGSSVMDGTGIAGFGLTVMVAVLETPGQTCVISVSVASIYIYVV